MADDMDEEAGIVVINWNATEILVLRVKWDEETDSDPSVDEPFAVITHDPDALDEEPAAESIVGPVNSVFAFKRGGINPREIFIFKSPGKGKSKELAGKAWDWACKIQKVKLDKLPQVYVVKYQTHEQLSFKRKLVQKTSHVVGLFSNFLQRIASGATRAIGYGDSNSSARFRSPADKSPVLEVDITNEVRGNYPIISIEDTTTLREKRKYIDEVDSRGRRTRKKRHQRRSLDAVDVYAALKKTKEQVFG